MQPHSPDHAEFWQWFQHNADRLLTEILSGDHAARERATDEVHRALAAVEPSLAFEFGGDADDKEFVLSADGQRDNVDIIKALVASAPPLPGWRVVAFRPRMEITSSMVVQLQGEEVGPDDVWFHESEEDSGLGMTLYVRGLTERNRQLRGLGAVLLMDHALGEHDALTLFAGLKAEPLPDDPAGAELRPFAELAERIDAVKREKFPPPGSLEVDLAGDWANLQGTIEDAPAFVLINTGLRSLMGHPAYDHLLVVSIPFHQVSDDGLPGSEEEFTAVSELGDRLADGLQEGQESLHAAVVTNQGRRDLVFYSSDPESALGRLDRLTAGASHEIQSKVERESFWDTYRSFM
jgi:hypothetical protein